jgi:hypothetical protein
MAPSGAFFYLFKDNFIIIKKLSAGGGGNLFL